MAAFVVTLVAVLTFAGVCGAGCCQLPTGTSKTSQTGTPKTRTKAMRLPRPSPITATACEMLNYLNTWTLEKDSQHVGLNIVLIPSTPQAGLVSSGSQAERTLLSIPDGQGSAHDLLVEICKQAGLDYRYEEHGVLIWSKRSWGAGGQEAPPTGLPDGCPPELATALGTSQVASLFGEESSVRSVAEMLLAQARNNEPTRNLNVSLVDVPADRLVTFGLVKVPAADGLRYLCLAAGLDLRYDTYLHCLALGAATRERGNSSDDAQFPLAIREKLNSIIIPRIPFEDAPASEVLQFIVLGMRENDPKGAGFSVLSSITPDRPVSLDLQNVRLGDALRHLCVAAQLELGYDDARQCMTVSARP